MAVKTLAACSKADPDDLFYWEEDHGCVPAGLKSLYLPAASASASPSWSDAARKRSTPAAAAAAPSAKKARISEDSEDEFSYMSELDLLEFRQRYINAESICSNEGNVTFLSKDKFLSSTGKNSPWIMVEKTAASKNDLNKSNRSVMVCTFSSSSANNTSAAKSSIKDSVIKSSSRNEASQKKAPETATFSSKDSAGKWKSRQQGAQAHAVACRVGRIHEDAQQPKQLSHRSPVGLSNMRKASAAVVPVDAATAAVAAKNSVTTSKHTPKSEKHDAAKVNVEGTTAIKASNVKARGMRRMRRWVSRAWSSVALNKWHNGN